MNAKSAETERLDIHAALNTYETATEPGTRLEGPQLDVVGANGRRLIVRETDEGLWIGGCLIKSGKDATVLVAFVRDAAANTTERGYLAVLADLVDPDPCWFDHHGGCQAHGYLSLEPGEKCPHAQAKDLLAAAASTTEGAL